MKPTQAPFGWKILLGFFAFLFSGFAVASGVLFFQLEKHPELPALVADPLEHDFGKVGECHNWQTVKLTNRSKQPLEILHSVSSCSCANVLLVAEKLLPGKSMEMEYVFDSYGRKGENGGHIAVGYHVQGREDENPQYLLVRFKAFVDPEITKNSSLPPPASPSDAKLIK